MLRFGQREEMYLSEWWFKDKMKFQCKNTIYVPIMHQILCFLNETLKCERIFMILSFFFFSFSTNKYPVEWWENPLKCPGINKYSWRLNRIQFRMEYYHSISMHTMML